MAFSEAVCQGALESPWQAGAGLTLPAFGAAHIPHLSPNVIPRTFARIVADGLSHGGAAVCRVPRGCGHAPTGRCVSSEPTDRRQSLICREVASDHPGRGDGAGGSGRGLAPRLSQPSSNIALGGRGLARPQG